MQGGRLQSRRPPEALNNAPRTIRIERRGGRGAPRIGEPDQIGVVSDLHRKPAER